MSGLDGTSDSEGQIAQELSVREYRPRLKVWHPKFAFPH